MSSNQSRLELLIDIFELKGQRALAMPGITPPELIEATLQEFRELEYLGDSPDAYRLLKFQDRSPLASESPIDKQLSDERQLVLVEHVLPLPKDARRPSRPVYLREQPMGRVHKLHWMPAIIGRQASNLPDNDLLAVELSSHEMGLRVSRRHAKISEEDGAFFIESLADNPTSIRDAQGSSAQLGVQKRLLQHGDIIALDHSRITFKFITR